MNTYTYMYLYTLWKRPRCTLQKTRFSSTLYVYTATIAFGTGGHHKMVMCERHSSNKYAYIRLLFTCVRCCLRIYTHASLPKFKVTIHLKDKHTRCCWQTVVWRFDYINTVRKRRRRRRHRSHIQFLKWKLVCSTHTHTHRHIWVL